MQRPHAFACKCPEVVFSPSLSMKASARLTSNIAYCLTHGRPFKALSLKEKAAKLGVNESTITRWLSGEVMPQSRNIARIAELMRITDASIFSLEHSVFVANAAKSKDIVSDFTSIKQDIVLGSIQKWKHLWGECAQRHAGSYLLYSRVMSKPDEVAKSLLRIKEETDKGIEFDIFNVDDRFQPAKPTIYRYDGLVFPIYECLSYYAEEESRNEPLSMISSSSQVTPPTLLTGYLAAVAVTPELRRPAGSRIVLSFHGRKLISVGEISGTLGIREPKDIDGRIARLLFE
jgi:transcriptional regulator with XRE-family HTH domain